MNRHINIFRRALPRQLQSLWAMVALVLCLSIASQAHAAYSDSDYSDFSPAELDQILAPIALYPDTVLSHILIASTYPLEVVEADRWARANPGLAGEEAVAAVERKNWDPSVQALVAFPQILRRMSEDLEWTQRLGDAFLGDEGQVMGAIQNLRYKAHEAGTLERMEHVRVERDQNAIIIEPAVERVVYVPVYDTRVVYGSWWWADYPPTYWHYPGVTYVSGFYWGPRIYVGPSFYFSSFHWHRRQVVYVDYRSYHRRPHFYSGRSIVHYHGSRQWRHNPHHRRGVAYHNDRVRGHYGSSREPSRARRAESPTRRASQVSDSNRRARQVPDSQQRHSSERVRERLSDNRGRDLDVGARQQRQPGSRGEVEVRQQRRANISPESRQNRTDLTQPQRNQARDTSWQQRSEPDQRPGRRATTSPSRVETPPPPARTESAPAPRETSRAPQRQVRSTTESSSTEETTTTREAPARSEQRAPARSERRAPARERSQAPPQRVEGASPRARDNRQQRTERQPVRRGH